MARRGTRLINGMSFRSAGGVAGGWSDGREGGA